MAGKADGEKTKFGLRGEDTGEGGAVAYGGLLDHFAESKELMSLIRALPAVYDVLRNREMSEERFTRKLVYEDLAVSNVLVHSHSGQISRVTTLTGSILG